MWTSGSRPENALRLAGRLLLAFLVLAGVWLLGRDAWAAGFRAACNAFAWAVGAGRLVEFHPALAEAGARSVADTSVLLLGPGGAPGSAFEIPSLRYSYVPLGVYASLVFATHRRDPEVRRGALVAGLLAVAAFVVLAVALTVSRMSILQHVPTARDAGALGLAVEFAYRILVNPPAFEYVVPAFIWLAARAVGMKHPASTTRADRRRRRVS
jgi:hypothetical protein